MNTIDIFRIAVDAGLFILIWVVQSVIYPGFLFYSKEHLAQWHKVYTPRIASVVGPLMLTQLGIIIYQVTFSLSKYPLVSIVIVSVIWLDTFLRFVPLHLQLDSIDATTKHTAISQQLIKRNWSRTICWTVLFLYTCWHYIA